MKRALRSKLYRMRKMMAVVMTVLMIVSILRITGTVAQAKPGGGSEAPDPNAEVVNIDIEKGTTKNLPEGAIDSTATYQWKNLKLEGNADENKYISISALSDGSCDIKGKNHISNGAPIIVRCTITNADGTVRVVEYHINVVEKSTTPGGEDPPTPGGEDPPNPGGEDPPTPGGEDPPDPPGPPNPPGPTGPTDVTELLTITGPSIKYYTGDEITLENSDLVVKYGDIEITDYSIGSYSNNIEPGNQASAVITINDTCADYTGSQSFNFTIQELRATIRILQLGDTNLNNEDSMTKYGTVPIYYGKISETNPITSDLSTMMNLSRMSDGTVETTWDGLKVKFLADNDISSDEYQYYDIHPYRVVAYNDLNWNVDCQVVKKTIPYTVTFKYGNQEVVVESVKGTPIDETKVPAYTKAEDDDNTYELTGWSTTENGTDTVDLSNINETTTLYPVFTPHEKSYTITFMNEDVTFAELSALKSVRINPDDAGTPTKAETATATFNFVKWVDELNQDVDFSTINIDTILKAFYEEVAKPATTGGEGENPPVTPGTNGGNEEPAGPGSGGGGNEEQPQNPGTGGGESETSAPGTGGGADVPPANVPNVTPEPTPATVVPATPTANPATSTLVPQVAITPVTPVQVANPVDATTNIATNPTPLASNPEDKVTAKKDDKTKKDVTKKTETIKGNNTPLAPAPLKNPFNWIPIMLTVCFFVYNTARTYYRKKENER